MSAFFEWLLNLVRPPSADLEIDVFQLENLIINRIPFTLIDLRRNKESSRGTIADYLRTGAVSLEAKAVEAHLQDRQVAQETPIVLVCEKGFRSGRVATLLSKKGYSNIYFAKFS